MAYSQLSMERKKEVWTAACYVSKQSMYNTVNTRRLCKISIESFTISWRTRFLIVARGYMILALALMVVCVVAICSCDASVTLTLLSPLLKLRTLRLTACSSSGRCISAFCLDI